jgi:hypothetical protein
MFVPVITACTVFVPVAVVPTLYVIVPTPPEIVKDSGIALPNEPLRPPVVLLSVTVVETV